MTLNMICLASETDCAANHPDYYWPPAEDFIMYENSLFNTVVFEYESGTFMAATADARGIYADGTSYDGALEDLRQAIVCRVFDKQGGIFRGTSCMKFQNKYFYDLEQDDLEDKIVKKYNCIVTVFERLKEYMKVVVSNDNKNSVDHYTAYTNFVKRV